MKRVVVTNPPTSLMATVEGRYIASTLKAISDATFENDPSVIASGFTVVNFTETRTLDAATATTTDLANVLATFLSDLARGGAKKG